MKQTLDPCGHIKDLGFPVSNRLTAAHRRPKHHDAFVAESTSFNLQTMRATRKHAVLQQAHHRRGAKSMALLLQLLPQCIVACHRSPFSSASLCIGISSHCR
jgi:hypothetical protein